MKTILVWYLISYGANGEIHWSPPIATEQECQRVKSTIYQGYYGNRGLCIQISEGLK